MRSALKMLTTQSVGKSGDSLKKIQAISHYQPFAAEVFDLPGHQLGAPLAGFQTLDQTARYIGEYLSEMRKETPDLPLIIFARSGSGPILSRTNQLFPGLIAGLIFMSPPFPGDPVILEAAIRATYEATKVDGNPVIPELSAWSRNNKLSISWKDYCFEGAPTLILTGAIDLEMTAPEREWYRRLAEKCAGNVEYHDIAGAVHDVLRLSTGKIGNTLPQVVESLGYIYEFADRVISKHK